MYGEISLTELSFLKILLNLISVFFAHENTVLYMSLKTVNVETQLKKRSPQNVYISSDFGVAEMKIIQSFRNIFLLGRLRHKNVFF